MKIIQHFFFFFLLSLVCFSQEKQINKQSGQPARIMPAAERMDVYLPLLKGKSVAVFANQTSVVGNSHLVDTLLKRGVNIKKIFAPEHGFRGNADAGENVNNLKDEKTGIQVISLYG